MSIQGLYGTSSPDSRLKLEWELVGIPIAISVQISLNSEFTVNSRIFVLPKHVRSCILDTGSGKWFYRVGAWIGGADDGVIEWSGIYGPTEIQSRLANPAPLLPFPTSLTGTNPVYNGIVFHTGLYETYYLIIHATQKDQFNSSGMKTYYKQDWGSGSVQLSGLDPTATHSFQLQMLVPNKKDLPTNSVVILSDVYEVRNKKTAMIVKPKTNTDHATYAADKAILQDSIGRRKQNFGSYAQYLQFQAAKARTSASQ
jgi:hypothetical protein